MVKYCFKQSSSIFSVLFLGSVLGVWAEPAKAAESKSGWQQEWKQTLDLAKKEGQLNVCFWGSTALSWNVAWFRFDHFAKNGNLLWRRNICFM